LRSGKRGCATMDSMGRIMIRFPGIPAVRRCISRKEDSSPNCGYVFL
jgi:hypothetical protein